MALTRDFKETIQARVERDPAFREALLKEGVECLLSGDVDFELTVLGNDTHLPDPPEVLTIDKVGDATRWHREDRQRRSAGTGTLTSKQI